ncbi:hypothetical protein OSB04_013100 [Centaurea solstitialis]|uniref:Uncharacterized protein n=1 Tax=Centaurea solstitialis TaxID=347529 RepID=A0AA38WR29_9ASTR|nr:hypothetical protein OSB04_013100 [Centaurea solstitialis]
MLQQRIRELEATCRSQAQPSKRRHDDPDDSAPGPHEGEVQAFKRLRIDLQSASGPGSSSAPASSTAPSESAADTPYVDSDTETLDVSDWHYDTDRLIRDTDSERSPENPSVASPKPPDFSEGDDILRDTDYDNLFSTIEFPTPEALQTISTITPESSTPTIIQLNWNHTVIFKPFLEESFTRIFQQEKLHVWSRKVFFGISHIKKLRKRTAYVHQRKCNLATHGGQRIQHRFTKKPPSSSSSIPLIITIIKVRIRQSVAQLGQDQMCEMSSCMEYPEVFPVDLDSLPPDRETELQICLNGRSDAYRQSIVSAGTGGDEIDDDEAARTALALHLGSASSVREKERRHHVDVHRLTREFNRLTVRDECQMLLKRLVCERVIVSSRLEGRRFEDGLSDLSWIM